MILFLLVFALGAVNALRETPVYQAHTQLMIETDQPKVAKLDQMFDSDRGYDEEYFQTQYRILQSRSLSKKAIDELGFRPSHAARALLSGSSRAGALGDALGQVRRLRYPEYAFGFALAVPAP